MNIRALGLLLALAAPTHAPAQSPPTAFLPGTVSGPANDYNLSVSHDGRTMVFARSAADFAGARIMLSQRGPGPNARWRTPRPVEFSDARHRDSDPWLTPDGLTLYFISDRPTATRPDKRDLDIWRSVKRSGRWQAPEHLGDEVNSNGEELGPEVHDGVLYFASARKSGMGGLDVYAAKATAEGFAKAERLPAPINSVASESDFTLSCDGTVALFWRQVGDQGLLHRTERAADGAWSQPEPLPDGFSIGPFNFTPAFNSNCTRLSFASTRAREGQAAGMADIYELDISGAAACKPARKCR